MEFRGVSWGFVDEGNSIFLYVFYLSILYIGELSHRHKCVNVTFYSDSALAVDSEEP